MRIALFTDSYYPEINGVANSVYTLFQELTALGHEVHVFAPSNKQAQREPNVHRIASMPLIFLKDRRSVVFSPALLARVNRYRFDVIHTHSEYLVGMLGRFVAKMRGVHCVHTYHTIWEDYTYYVTHGIAEARARRLAAKFSGFWCNHCDAIIVPTGKIQGLLERYGVHTPMTVIPTGLDLERFSPSGIPRAEIAACRAECGVLPDRRVFLYIGRIAKEKNLETVMGAMPAVMAACPAAVFVLVGEGPWIPVLREQARALGIGGRVIFTGPKPWAQIHKYYAMGDVFVSASQSETQGLTYIEAMAAGLTVVAREDPCLNGVLEHGANGLLFGEEKMLPDLLLRALSPEAASLGAAAAQTAQRYSKAAFARAVERVYMEG